MRSMWRSLLANRFGGAATESSEPRAKLQPQFERLETRENPAAQADAIVWGASWQEYHVGSDNHFHIQYSNNGGPVQDLDLSAALGSNTAFAESGSPVVATTFGNNPYVFVRANSQHLHAFYWNGSAWGEVDLSVAAGYTKGALPAQISAHVWNGVPHVFFGGVDQRVHELYWTNNVGWRGFDVSVASGSNALADFNAPLTALVANDGSERVYYMASDKHLRELKWTGAAGWADADVSGSGTPMYFAADELSAIATANGVNVYYTGADMHIYQLANSGGAWSATDLTAAAGLAGVVADTNCSLQAYVHNGKVNVYYRAEDDHLRGFQWNAGVGWTANDLTAQTGATNLGWAGTGNIVSLTTAGTEALFYVDENKRVDRMFNWGDPLFGWLNVNGLNY